MEQYILDSEEYDLHKVDEISNKLKDMTYLRCADADTVINSNLHWASVAAGTLLLVSSVNLLDKVQFKQGFSDSSLMSYDKSINIPLNNYLRDISRMVPNYSGGSLDIIKKIVSFRSLNYSWDGYGAYPLEVEAASNAIQIVNQLPKIAIHTISDIFPNPNGTISFLWENENDERVSLEIGNSNFSYYVKYNSQKVMFFDNKPINDKEVFKLADFISAI